MDEKIIGAIASALQIEASEFAESLKVDGKLLEGDDLHSKVTEVIRDTIKTAKDDQHKRGLRTSEEALVKWMKSQGFTNPDKLKGSALLDAFNQWKDDQHQPDDEGKKPAEMSEAELEKLPGVKAIVTRKLSAVNAEVDATKKEFEDYKKEQGTKEVKQEAKGYIAKLLTEKGARLEVDGVTKEQRLDNFYRLVDFGRVKIGDDKKPYLVDENGDPATNENGRRIAFDDYIIDLNKGLYGFQKQDPGKGSPSPGSEGGGKGEGGGDPKFNFATRQDADRVAQTSTDPKERLAAITWLADPNNAKT